MQEIPASQNQGDPVSVRIPATATPVNASFLNAMLALAFATTASKR